MEDERCAVLFCFLKVPSAGGWDISQLVPSVLVNRADLPSGISDVEPGQEKRALMQSKVNPTAYVRTFSAFPRVSADKEIVQSVSESRVPLLRQINLYHAAFF